MTNLVPPDLIERIVGTERAEYIHLGRAVSKEQQFYILHSHTCLDRNKDLRNCKYSKALDNGVEFEEADTVLLLGIVDDFLVGIRIDDE